MKTLNELVNEMPLGLPMPKNSVIDKSESKIIFRKGKNETNVRYRYWTPEGYKYRTMFNRWLNGNNLTIQEWYDKYYLNIVAKSQRPKCEYCGNEAKWKGLDYSHVCSRSCSSYLLYSGENGKEVRDKLSKSHKNNPKLLESIRLANLKPEVKANKSKAAKKRDNTPEGRLRASERSRKLWDRENSREEASIRRKSKFKDDKEFRDKMFSVLNNNLKKGKKGHCYVSNKCLNSKSNYVEYDSSYELAYLRQLDLDDSVLSYIREPRSLDISFEFKGTHWYWPDFIVTYSDGSKKMIEIKSNDMLNYPENLAKYDAGKKYCSENNMTYSIITEDEVFNAVSKSEAYEIHNYYQSLKIGFKSTDEKIKDLIYNNIK